MNFFKFFLYVLGNQKGNLNLNNDIEAMLEDVNLEEGTDESEESTDETQLGEGGQPEEELSLEDQFEKVESENVDQSKLLELVNSLGIIRKGLPVEFEDIDKIKEVLGQGFDYTQKTMELAESRKTFEAEMTQIKSSFEKERQAFEEERAGHKEVLTNYPVLTAMLGDIQANDPELFAELDQYFLKASSSIGATNPIISEMDQRFKKLEEKLEGASRKDQEKELESIRTSWEKELTETQTALGPKLRTLGIRPDWAKVKEIWSADKSNQMTVKSALFAAHGDKIQAALESRANLAQTKKTANRLGVTDSQDDQSGVFGMESGNDYFKEAMKFANEL